ncbi:hypothetical protein DL95DRAFT_15844 [Leptodontidium sp. 2 PMI_412]|nr:hypothetical protein DL95DRAFT_15844 [Leptodontidium sp. 2 PMI_412]
METALDLWNKSSCSTTAKKAQMEEASTSQQVIVASPRATFSTLPTELHLQIASYLTYPDALSLKHTNRHLYGIVYTGVNLKVEWLIERRTLHLDCPHDKKCELGSDMRFCRGSVRLLMKRRREHGECDTREGGRGCLVFDTKVCTFRKPELGRLERIKKLIGMNALRWILAALVGIVLALCFRQLDSRVVEADDLSN